MMFFTSQQLGVSNTKTSFLSSLQYLSSVVEISPSVFALFHHLINLFIL